MMHRTAPLFLLALVAGAAAAASNAPKLTSFEMGCYHKTDPSALEKEGGKGRSYRGLLTHTASGRTCQKWTDTVPWNDTAKFKAEADVIDGEVTTWGNGIGNHNYCRNPDPTNMEKPWCFTVDSKKEHKKEFCDIPECPAKTRDWHAEAQDLAIDIGALTCTMSINGESKSCVGQLYGNRRYNSGIPAAEPHWSYAEWQAVPVLMS